MCTPARRSSAAVRVALVVGLIAAGCSVGGTKRTDTTTTAATAVPDSQHVAAAPASALRVNRGVAYVDTPDGPRVVRGAGDGHVFALDPNTGAPVWDVSIGDPRAGETVPAAPIAWNGMIFVGLDARTGDVKFRYGPGQPVGGGIASYGLGGKQRVAVARGMTSPTWKSTGTTSRVIVFGLP